jgi:outer membrane receptor protein involved in Fe transport
LRATLGTRFDAIGADITADNPLNSGSASDAIVSPKATLAWRVSDVLELYADAGRGFHSNDARGATETVAPKTGLPADPVKLIAPASGAESGARWQRDGFTATATVFYLHLDSELTFSGDAGDTESASATERWGSEVLFNWHPIPRIDIDASASATNAHYLGNPEGGSRIPNAIEYTFTGGISALITDALTATITVRHLGPSPLIEDASVKSRPATIANLLLRYQFGRVMVTGEVLNLLDSHADDIEYFYTSRLSGEPAAGVNDLHIHPAEPRTWRIGARMMF